MTLDAPLFQPAAKFEQPRFLPQELNVTTASLATLLADKEASVIVLTEAPILNFMLGLDVFKPYVDNFSLRSLIQFKMLQKEAVDRIDAKLQALAAKKGTIG